MAKRVKVRLVEVREAEVFESDIPDLLEARSWGAAGRALLDRVFARSYVTAHVEQEDAKEWKAAPRCEVPRKPVIHETDQLAVWFDRAEQDFMFHHPRRSPDSAYAHSFFKGDYSFPEFLREMWTRGFDPRSLVLKLTYRKDLLTKNRTQPVETSR
jgi:hypothetical protein